MLCSVNWMNRVCECERVCTQFRAKRNLHGHARGAHITNLYLLISDSNNVCLFRWWLPSNMQWIGANVAHRKAREADSHQLLCGAIKLMFCSLRVNFWPFAETNYNTLRKRILESKKEDEMNFKLGHSDRSGRDAQIDFIVHSAVSRRRSPSSSICGYNFI